MAGKMGKTIQFLLYSALFRIFLLFATFLLLFSTLEFICQKYRFRLIMTYLKKRGIGILNTGGFSGKRRSLVGYTAFMVSVIFIAAVITLSALLLQMFSSQMYGRLIVDKMGFTAEAAGSINDIFTGLTRPIVSLGINIHTQRLLQDRLIRYSPEWLASIREIDGYLEKAFLFNTQIVDVALVKPDSTVVYSYANILDRNYDYCAASWFRESLLQPGLLKYAPPHGCDHYYSQYRERPYTVSIIFPVNRTNSALGYILYEVDIARMSRIFLDRNGMDEGFILMEESGKVIFDYRGPRSPGELRGINAYLASYDGNTAVLNGNLYASRRLDSTGWFLLSETNIRVITDPLRRIMLISAGVLSAAMALSLLLITRVLKQVRVPMNRLIERIVRYDGTGAVPLEKTDDQYSEIFTIHTKFEEMADKVSALIKNIYEEQRRRRETEFAALSNQINPHFLYNILQTIQGEAVLANNQVIEDMVTDLAEMLRYTMDRDRDEAFLSDELAHIDRYLKFYKARFPDLFVYEIRCDTDPALIRIPRLSLQPIVENCFKHGFCDRKSGGVITIAVEQESPHLSIKIRDNGQGIPAEWLAVIQQKTESTQQFFGIGLANTNARIKLKYGAGYGIVIESEEGVFTQIDLRIPAHFPGRQHV
jgi:sensor histidine kinase YesM